MPRAAAHSATKKGGGAPGAAFLIRHPWFFWRVAPMIPKYPCQGGTRRRFHSPVALAAAGYSDKTKPLPQRSRPQTSAGAISSVDPRLQEIIGAGADQQSQLSIRRYKTLNKAASSTASRRRHWFRPSASTGTASAADSQRFHPGERQYSSAASIRRI